MLRWLLAAGFAAILCCGEAAMANPREECLNGTDSDQQIKACTQVIGKNARDSEAYQSRGSAYLAKEDAHRAIADFSKAIEFNARDAISHSLRAAAYWSLDELDRAMADYSRAVELDPRFFFRYSQRGMAYLDRGDLDRAIDDFTKALSLLPAANDYTMRGTAYARKGDFARAMADYDRAIASLPTSGHARNARAELLAQQGSDDRALAEFNEASRVEPNYPAPHRNIGLLYMRRGDHDGAIAKLSEAVRINPQWLAPLADRCAAHEAKGQIDLAIADCSAVLKLKPHGAPERQVQADTRHRLAALESRKRAQAQATSSIADKMSPPGRRVALVIANSGYSSVGRLTNPANDGRAIAASLRRLGFAEVIERYDLGHAGMGTALKEFGDKVIGAEWAVVYFAGHGIEVNGSAYLIPTDAKLERDTHVTDETVPLSRVLEKVESAQKLRLVILDACRNNPFVARMVRSAASRSIGRGLAQIEPESGVLVAYAAKHGTVAEDGSGANSPFAEALLGHLEEPGLEINFLFRRVRDQVLTRTGRRQEPYLYGSLPSESLYFKVSDAR
jgi:tetratricopeptide (TPR) repeat protein